MNRESSIKKIKNKYEKIREESENKISDLSEEAAEIIVSEARKILSNDDNLYEYLMAMGMCFFTIKDGGKYDWMAMSDEDAEAWYESDTYVRHHKGIIDDKNFHKDFFDMVKGFNDLFNICGYPMRFTANSEIVYDWGISEKIQ